MCVCRLLLWRGCNPRLRQTLQVVEPRTPVRTPPRASDPARLEVRGWRSWRLEEQDTQEGVTGVDQQLVAELAREGWGRGARARAPKSALRNYPVPLLAPASRPRGRCKVAHNISQKPCKFGPKHSMAKKNVDFAQIDQGHCRGGGLEEQVVNILGHPGGQQQQGPSVDCGAAFAKTACRLGAAWRSAAPGTELGQVPPLLICPPKRPFVPLVPRQFGM